MLVIEQAKVYIMEKTVLMKQVFLRVYNDLHAARR
jgi:hypothetical protein